MSAQIGAGVPSSISVQGNRPDVSAAMLRASKVKGHRYCIPLIGSGLFGANSKFLPTEIYRDLDFVFTLAAPNMFIKVAGDSRQTLGDSYTLENVMLRVDYISLPEAINAQLQSTFANGNRITMRLPAFSVTQQSMLLADAQETQHTAVITDTLSSVRAVYCVYKQDRNQDYYKVGTHYHFTEPGKTAVAANLDSSGFRWFQLQNGAAMIPNNPITEKTGLLCQLNDAVAGSVQANLNIDPYDGAHHDSVVVNEYGDFVGYGDDELIVAQFVNAYHSYAVGPPIVDQKLGLPVSTTGGKFVLACPLVAYNAGSEVLVGQRVDHDLIIHTRWYNALGKNVNYRAFYILAYDRIVSAGMNGISTMQ